MSIRWWPLAIVGLGGCLLGGCDPYTMQALREQTGSEETESAPAVAPAPQRRDRPPADSAEVGQRPAPQPTQRTRRPARAETAPPSVEPAAESASAAPQPRTEAPATTAAQSAGPQVRLSIPVALPQTLPMGTSVSFSVNYEFELGGPDPSARYFWMIAGATGRQVAIPVRLQRAGNLGQLGSPFGPTDGPFRMWLAEKRGGSLRAISPPSTVGATGF